MTGQTDLFKSKRQRGTKPPSPVEFNLHCQVADTLQRWKQPGWRYTHIPLGEYRDKITAGRLKRMGVVGGWPDFMLMSERGSVCFLELKRKGGKLSDSQLDIRDHLRRAGHRYENVDSLKDAIAALTKWGVLRLGIEVQ